MTTRAALLALAVLGCGGSPAAPASPVAEPPPTGAERLLAMLPQGAQIVAEIDLSRLRANPVIGAVVTRALAAPGEAPAGPAARGAGWLRGVLGAGDNAAAAASPLGDADAVVLAAYGVGTAQAATLTLLAARHDVAGATRIADGVYALGPPDWVEQAEQRVALAGTGDASFAIHAPADLMTLRAHAMPANAPGASLRLTARLPFDARVALARQTGLDVAPAQVSAWGDVVDDAALVIDCDASDPGSAPAGGKRGDPARRLAATLRTVLAGVADLPTVRRLGLPSSLEGARLIARGSWVRTIVAIGPAHLRRIAERAGELLAAPPAAPSDPTGDPPS